MRFLIALLLAVPVYGADLRILFIGNSLTYINDLPSMVRRIGEIDGREIETTMVAAPNYSLEDHLMSQRMAAEAIDGVLIPAGEAWYRIVKDGGGLGRARYLPGTGRARAGRGGNDERSVQSSGR